MAEIEVTLVEFLRARLGEDEAAARTYPSPAPLDDDWKIAALAQVALIGAARVLRDVEAKRKILAEHLHGTDDYPNGGPFSRRCPTLLALAAVYSDHPDFRTEWA